MSVWAMAGRRAWVPERRGETGLSTGAAVEAERCWRQGGPGEGRSAVELFGGALGRPEEK
jgi:hypothetical protein